MTMAGCDELCHSRSRSNLCGCLGSNKKREADRGWNWINFRITRSRGVSDTSQQAASDHSWPIWTCATSAVTILGAAHVGLISNDGAFKTEVLQIVVKNRHARSHLASCATSSVVHMSPLMTVHQIFVKTFQTYVRNRIANFPQFSWAVHMSKKRKKNWKRLCMHKLNNVRPTPRPLCQQQMQHSCKDLVYMIVGNSSG